MARSSARISAYTLPALGGLIISATLVYASPFLELAEFWVPVQGATLSLTMIVGVVGALLDKTAPAARRQLDRLMLGWSGSMQAAAALVLYGQGG